MIQNVQHRIAQVLLRELGRSYKPSELDVAVNESGYAVRHPASGDAWTIDSRACVASCEFKRWPPQHTRWVANAKT